MAHKVVRDMSAEETEAKRREIMRDLVKPYIRKVFHKYPQLQSAMLLVAQYWNDEAHDAVHEEVLFSVLDFPDLNAARVARAQSEDYYRDEVNLPGLNKDIRVDINFSYIARWNENTEAIPLFAAFCSEGAHQEMKHLEGYSPYAVFKRSEQDIDIEIVGTMLRPWLDGVAGEWQSEY